MKIPLHNSKQLIYGPMKYVKKSSCEVNAMIKWYDTTKYFRRILYNASYQNVPLFYERLFKTNFISAKLKGLIYL